MTAPQDNVVAFAPTRESETQLSFDRDLNDGPAERAELTALVEALLLVSPTPATVDELAAGAGVPSAAIERVLADFDQSAAERGWMVQRHGGKIQLATAPRFAAQVRRFLGLNREAKLSSAAIETLAIIAYQQPVTKGEIERVRGVDCSGVLATLHARGLIDQVGRLASPGNPIQYGTTPDFLQHFGMRSLGDLPALGRIGDQDARSLLDATVAAAGIDAMLLANENQGPGHEA